MSMFFLGYLENKWDRVRETSSSQKLKVEIADYDGLKAQIDIHYTGGRIATVSAAWIGEKSRFTEGVINSVFNDLSQIVIRHGDYEIIDYSFTWSNEISEGNYSISDRWYKSGRKEPVEDLQYNSDEFKNLKEWLSGLSLLAIEIRRKT